MRGALLVILLAALAGCGGGSASGGNGNGKVLPPRAPAAFLAHLPKSCELVVRLPSLDVAQSKTASLRRFLQAMGKEPKAWMEESYGSAEGKGIDPGLCPGLAVVGPKAWVRYYPAGKKTELAQAVSARTSTDVVYREQGDYGLLSTVGLATAEDSAGPLPDGDFALKSSSNPLLSTFAGSGDALVFGANLMPHGLALKGSLEAGPKSPTAAVVANAPALSPRDGPIDFLANSLAVRVETTIPPALLADWLAARVSFHCGIGSAGDRTVLVRLLREAFTGLDPRAGIAFGVEFFRGKATLVLAGKIAPGPASPILRGLHGQDRRTIGALVLDPLSLRGGLFGRALWILDANPKPTTLPESFWNLVGDATDRSRGLTLAYGEADGWCACALGARAETLAYDTLERIRNGGPLTRDSILLSDLKGGLDGKQYLLGATLDFSPLSELADADRATLRAILGATDSAPLPQVLALVAYRQGKTLRFQADLAD